MLHLQLNPLMGKPRCAMKEFNLNLGFRLDGPQSQIILFRAFEHQDGVSGLSSVRTADRSLLQGGQKAAKHYQRPRLRQINPKSSSQKSMNKCHFVPFLGTA